MSIANEINRIISAKENIRESIEKRGISVDNDALVDSYGEKIESAPYAVKGFFTPEADTQVFSLSGLPFAPKAVYMFCDELYTMNVDDVVVLSAHGEGVRGVTVSRTGGSNTTSFLSPTSSLAQWNTDGYSIDLSKSSGAMKNVWFKAGYTYEYYIAGGFSQ